MTLITPDQLERANALLGGVLGDRAEIGLADACRNVALADRHERALPNGVKPITISALLRKRGFARVGQIGTGYDRQPLYRKLA